MLSYPLRFLYLSLLLVVPGFFQSATGQTLRILPMGDSITDGSSFDSPDGTGGYRGPLYELLTNAGFTIDYVGTSTVNSGQLVEKEHEGHGGWRIDQLDANVAAWFAAIATPDIVLLHIGTNDFGQGNNTISAIDRLDALITKIAGLSPATHIIVTNLMERGEPQNTAIQTEFNPYVQGMVDDHIGNGNLVSFLDMRAAVPLSDMPDDLHPDQSGYNKMAVAWYGAILAALDPGDAVPPALLGAEGVQTADQVIVSFNKSLDKASAETVGNYAIDHGISILGAELSPSGRVVTLTTSPQTLGTTYTLTVNNIRDQVLPTPNTIAANATTTFTQTTPAGYFNNVDESNCYTLVYSLDIPSNANYSVGSVPYDIDYRDRIGGFDRVAYYMELQKPGGDLQYAWASMDAFTSNLDEIGVPAMGTGATFQQGVTNMNVVSNVGTVANGEGLAGNLEFWPTDYSPANGEGVLGASDQTYDFGDMRNGNDAYGSMQVHNTDGAQTVIAFNRWGGGFPAPIDIGLGNSTGVNPDWSFEQNGASYSVRRLQVLVRTTGDLAPPTLASAEASFGNEAVTVMFSEPVRAETLVASNFSLDKSVLVLGLTIGEDLRQVTLQTTSLPAGALTLTVSNLRDTSQNANLIVPGSTIAVSPPTLPAEVVANIGASADGYELLYTIDIPTLGNFNASRAAYTVDNIAGVRGFSRVAYYLELQTAGNPVEYVWASMDAFTKNPNLLGVPISNSGAFFQQTVDNLEVLSNKAGIVTGSGITTGNIEFWPGNYSRDNTLGIPNASASVFDFGDGDAYTNAGYGSMQVHNHGASQTLIALNHFGTDGQELCLGIGNNPAPVSGGTDWTFADNAADYTRRVMHVMILPTPLPPVPAEVLANVPESSSYELVYSLDVPANGNLSGGAGFTAYDVDASGIVDPFSRVAYYLELQATGDAQPTFVWVSMDAFASDRRQLGVPNRSSGAVWQQRVTNLNIVSNSPNVTTGMGLSGNLEFWPTNYQESNSLPVPGASVDVFDFGDKPTPYPTPGDYGSMQVHNYVAGETLFAINSWGRTGKTGDPLCLGIGNRPNSINTDWTFADNAPDYDLRRRLHVLVLPGPSPFGGPQFEAAIPSTTLDRLSIRFDREVSDSSADAGNFTIDGGLAITGATMRAGNREVILTTSAQTAGTRYTVTATGGVFGRSASGTEIAVGETVPFTAYTPPAALANVPESGYELIYQLSIPANSPQWNLNPITYSIDEAKFGERTFDRVAYLMEIDGDWVYASFDPHTNQIAQIGVPTLPVTSTPFQQIVDNMNVASNVAGIVTGDGIATGNIEFWGGNYQPANALGIPGADPTTFDFGDIMTAGVYGSMQIHNHDARQTIMAYNDWGSGAGAISETGIGNNAPLADGEIDWTFSDSANDSTTRTLYVLARPGGTPDGDAPEILSQPCDREVAFGSDTTFSVDLTGSGPFTYQWRLNGVDIPGQTYEWLELSSVSAVDIGSYDVVVTGTNLISTTSMPALLSVTNLPPSAIISWRADNGFNPADGSTPGDGDLEDREADGLVNLLEFGFGTDPNVNDNVSLALDGSVNGNPITELSYDDGADFHAVFVRRDDHGQPGSLIYTVQFSSDLVTFHDSAATPIFVVDSSDDPDYEVVKVPYPSSTPDGDDVRYFRVKVTLVP